MVIFDKAYVDFLHLHDLAARGVQWVTRAKDNLQYRVRRNRPVPQGSRILKDQIIVLKGAKWRTCKGRTLRRVEALVEVDGRERVMGFIPNNAEWSARSVCDLYRARWEIEVFLLRAASRRSPLHFVPGQHVGWLSRSARLKQVKQTLKLGGFLGHSANAIRWQVRSALLVYVLLRFSAHLSAWHHSFVRLFAVVRAAMWERLDLSGLLRSYGTAGGSFTLLGAVHTSWLPGLEPPRT